MSLIQKIEQDYIVAYKAKDSVRLTVLRLLKTAMKNLQVELMRPIKEDETLDLVMKQVKQRRDSIEQFINAKRTDLAEKEEAELKVLQDYLPQALTQDELIKVVDAAVLKLEAKTQQDMGKVMQLILSEYKGRIEGKHLSDAVRSRLS
ncbi:GatB/YqeY domain-containing protein [Desulfovibrio litoralis]|uniref:GatB/YqeY domain-containing protein n=1 Tax=Desulfovibrio litoralis DSM 11393 TaxID=1121455 RepID=A0A1M7RZV5_9BACT|nr:GatB/YqeY domain-containing protein [Desulfovibrio litoralis]SHN51857.1 hypothetical protein SAMN02745728_00389 [Desulfovibrio litoralis DSM 11393]